MGARCRAEQVAEEPGVGVRGGNTGSNDAHSAAAAAAHGARARAPPHLALLVGEEVVVHKGAGAPRHLLHAAAPQLLRRGSGGHGLALLPAAVPQPWRRAMQQASFTGSPPCQARKQQQRPHLAQLAKAHSVARRHLHARQLAAPPREPLRVLNVLRQGDQGSCEAWGALPCRSGLAAGRQTHAPRAAAAAAACYCTCPSSAQAAPSSSSAAAAVRPPLRRIGGPQDNGGGRRAERAFRSRLLLGL